MIPKKTAIKNFEFARSAGMMNVFESYKTQND